MKKKSIGLILGILIPAAIYLLPLKNLSEEGRRCLSLSLMAVILWACQVTQPGYTSALLLGLYIIFDVAKPADVLYAWTNSAIYLIIGAYLIASAVKTSGLGERIAYWFISKFVRSFMGVMFSIFSMTLLLSIIIPHPWPRAFLIMSIMKEVIENAKISKRDSITIGYTVFAISVPIGMMLLTGDSSINPLAVQYSGVELGWLGWFKLMALPAFITSVITCAAIIIVFKPESKMAIDSNAAKLRLQNLGKLTAKEKRVIIWLTVSVVLWCTDSLHGMDIGWITLVIAALMSFPVIGELLTPEGWKEVPVHVLLFISAAMAIGKVGALTGMNEWIAATFLSYGLPTNAYVLALVIFLASAVIHMMLGSVIAVMSVVIPAILAFTAGSGINPIVPALWAYTTVTMQYIFPFQNMSILVGCGEENGLYSQRETIRFSVPLFVITIISVMLETIWWKIIGVLA